MSSNNPFEDHGVEYLSPSSISKFLKDPAKWLVNIAGYKDRAFSPAMSYGTCLEHGITHGLQNDATVNDCMRVAYESYDAIYDDVEKNKADYDFQGCEKKKELLHDTLDSMLDLFRAYGTPTAVQNRVELEIDDLPVPIIGYTDLEYETQVRDIKTTALPPKLKQDYNRQLSFYAKATDKKPFIDCIQSTKTKKELTVFEIQNTDQHFDDLKRIAFKMMRLLSLSSDIREVCYLSCLEPDISNEDWSKQWGANEIVGAKELFFI